MPNAGAKAEGRARVKRAAPPCCAARAGAPGRPRSGQAEGERFPCCQGLQYTRVGQPGRFSTHGPSGAKPSSAPARTQPARRLVPARRGKRITGSDGKKLCFPGTLERRFRSQAWKTVFPDFIREYYFQNCFKKLFLLKPDLKLRQLRTRAELLGRTLLCLAAIFRRARCNMTGKYLET